MDLYQYRNKVGEGNEAYEIYENLRIYEGIGKK